MVSGLRNPGSFSYNTNVSTSELNQAPVAAKEKKTSVVSKKENDSFDVTTTTESASGTQATDPLAAPVTASKAAKKPGKIGQLWNKGMTALIPLTKKEIATDFGNNFTFGEAEEYKLDIKADIDLTVKEEAQTADQKAYFASHKGAMVIGSKINVDLQASATTPCDYVDSAKLGGGISLDVQVPVAVDPDSTPTTQVCSTAWKRVKEIVADLPYTANTCKKMAQGTQVTASFNISGGVALSAEDNSVEAERRTKVTVTVERGAGGKMQLTVTRQRVDDYALKLTTGDLFEQLVGGYKRAANVDQTTVEVFNIDLDNAAQMAALQKALPWTCAGGKCKWLPGSDTSELKKLGCADEKKAQEIKKRTFSDMMHIKGENDQLAGGMEVSRKFEDGKYTISSLVNAKLKQEDTEDKGLSGSRSNTLILPDKEGALSNKQATAAAFKLNHFNTEAWRTTPVGTKLTSLVSSSLALTREGEIGKATDKLRGWQLDPTLSNAITVEVEQTAAGPVVTVIEQNKEELLAQIKANDVKGADLCSQINEFGLYESIEDFLQNDGKKLKEKYPDNYEEIESQLTALVKEQLSYNMRLSSGVSHDGVHKVSFGPFNLTDAEQKNAFTSLTSDLNLQEALTAGLLKEVDTQGKVALSGGVGLNNARLATDGSWDKGRDIKVERDGNILTLTVTDSKIRGKGLQGAANNVFEGLDESDIALSGSRTRSVTDVKVYVLDLSKPQHNEAWLAAVAERSGKTSDFELNLNKIDALNVRDAAKEKITKNTIYAATIDMTVADGPMGSTMQLSHNYKDGVHTVGNVIGFNYDFLYNEEAPVTDKKLKAGVTGSSTLTLPDAKGELSNRQVQDLNNKLSQNDIETWKNAASGTKMSTTFGTSLDTGISGDLAEDEANKIQPWSVDLSGKFISTVQIEQTDKGTMVTLVQTRKADLLAAFKSTSASDLSVSDKIKSYGIYAALDDYLQNNGKKLKAKYGKTDYAAISEELKKLVEEQQAKNIGISAKFANEKAYSTSFGPFDLSKAADIKLFSAAAAGNMKPALDAGRLATVTTKKVKEAGGDVKVDRRDINAQGKWENEQQIEFRQGKNGTLSLVVTNKKLLDSDTGASVPDLFETISISYNTKIKNQNTQIEVYDLDLNNPAHKAALESCLAQVNNSKEPEKALAAVKALNVRNPEKEKLENTHELTGDIKLATLDGKNGAAVTIGREHKDGKYNFSNLVDLQKQIGNEDKPIGSIGNAKFGVSFGTTIKMDLSIPDENGKLSLGDAQQYSLNLSSGNVEYWQKVPVGTTMTHLTSGTFKATAGAQVGKEVSLFESVKLNAKASISLTPDKTKIIGNTVTMTKEGPVVTVWQEDISKIAFNLEATAGLTSEIKEFGVYESLVDWANGGGKLLQKYGPKGLEAASKALDKLVADYCNASFKVTAASEKKHKETVTFGPFDVTDANQRAIFTSLVTDNEVQPALDANMLQFKQTDDTKSKISDITLKLSVLDMSVHSELSSTNSNYTIMVGAGDHKEQIDITSYQSEFIKKGSNFFKGENFVYEWNAFTAHKITAGKPDLLDVVFCGSLDISDKRTKESEANNWLNFARALDLDITDKNIGKKKAISGYGRGKGKLKFGYSVQAFTDILKNWEPTVCRNVYLETAAKFKNIEVPPSELDRTEQGLYPFDTRAIRLADDYNSAFTKRTKKRLEEEFKAQYPKAPCTLAEYAKACSLLEDCCSLTYISEGTKAKMLRKYAELTHMDAQADLAVYQKSWFIVRYASFLGSHEQRELQAAKDKYQAITGRSLYQDVILIEEADLFMERMTTIHDNWDKSGHDDGTASMREVVDGIIGFGKKNRPWNILGANNDDEMFLNMAVFLNLAGKGQNAIEMTYKSSQFNIAAKGNAAINETNLTTLIEEQKKAVK